MTISNAANRFPGEENFGNGKDQIVQGAQEIAHSISDKVQETANQVTEAGGKALNEISRQGSEQAHRVEKFIREEPMKAVLVATGLGMLVGALLRR